MNIQLKTRENTLLLLASYPPPKGSVLICRRNLAVFNSSLIDGLFALSLSVCLVMSLQLHHTAVGSGLELGLGVEALLGLLVEGHQVGELRRLGPDKNRN